MLRRLLGEYFLSAPVESLTVSDSRVFDQTHGGLEHILFWYGHATYIARRILLDAFSSTISPCQSSSRARVQINVFLFDNYVCNHLPSFFKLCTLGLLIVPGNCSRKYICMAVCGMNSIIDRDFTEVMHIFVTINLSDLRHCLQPFDSSKTTG